MPFSIAYKTSVQLRVNKLMFWYAFLMAFPTLLIFQNLSVYLFPFLIYGMYELTGRFVILKNATQIIALAFGIGAMISVANMPETQVGLSRGDAFTVLPNYLYWVVLIFFLVSFSEYIHLPSVYRGVTWGIVCSILYFYFFQQLGLISLPIFKGLSQNTFSFLLICFTPIVVWYIQYRLGFTLAVLILIILVINGFLSGSRSGSLLTLSGGALTLILNRRSLGWIFVIGLVAYFSIVATIDTQFVKGTVKNLNERTYNLVYNTEQTLEEDRSYLVRLAQIEKSLLIFEKYPFSGIGLNNFTNYKVRLPGNFEGSEFVIHKNKIDQKSAHNSYIGFMAEGGLVVIVPFVLLLLYLIIWFFVKLSKLKPEDKPIFIAIIHMGIHLYFIYAILNVFAWFLIGLGCMLIVRYKK